MWANGFSPQSSAFQSIAVFTDFAVTHSEPSGKIFLSLRDGLSDAVEMDDLLVSFLVAKGYAAVNHGHFFVGSYAGESMSVSAAQDMAGPTKEPPFHTDPQLGRQLKKDLLEAFKAFSEVVAGGEDRAAGAAIPKEVAQRIGGNYHSSGFVLVIGQARRLLNKKEIPPPMTPEDLRRLRASFLAVGYFEAMSGRLVFFRKQELRKNRETGDFRNALKEFHEAFPPADATRRFEIPPFPRFETQEGAEERSFMVTPAEIMAGFEAPRMGILRNRGSVPFTKTPIASRSDTILLMPGTLVRIIGHNNVYTKVVLEDGSVGWIPTTMIWIRK